MVPAGSVACASVRVLLQIHRSGDSGSPRVWSSISASKRRHQPRVGHRHRLASRRRDGGCGPPGDATALSISRNPVGDRVARQPARPTHETHAAIAQRQRFAGRHQAARPFVQQRPHRTKLRRQLGTRRSRTASVVRIHEPMVPFLLPGAFVRALWHRRSLSTGPRERHEPGRGPAVRQQLLEAGHAPTGRQRREDVDEVRQRQRVLAGGAHRRVYACRPARSAASWDPAKEEFFLPNAIPSWAFAEDAVRIRGGRLREIVRAPASDSEMSGGLGEVGSWRLLRARQSTPPVQRVEDRRESGPGEARRGRRRRVRARPRDARSDRAARSVSADTPRDSPCPLRERNELSPRMRETADFDPWPPVR